ncbi:hypothetical protein CCR97_06855 [Rhodoplanes elegans]|nr:hypothetical protein [Rhodoplanes elegans]
MVERDPYFMATTPFAGAPTVVCWRETWERKLGPAGRTGPGTESLVVRTLAEPTAVVAGTSNPGYLAFVNAREVSPGSGAPFVVFVDPLGVPWPAVASIGYRRDFKDLTRHVLLWPSPTSDPGSTI